MPALATHLVQELNVDTVYTVVCLTYMDLAYLCYGLSLTSLSKTDWTLNSKQCVVGNVNKIRAYTYAENIALIKK